MTRTRRRRQAARRADRLDPAALVVPAAGQAHVADPDGGTLCGAAHATATRRQVPAETDRIVCADCLRTLAPYRPDWRDHYDQRHVTGGASE